VDYDEGGSNNLLCEFHSSQLFGIMGKQVSVNPHNILVWNH